MRISRHIAGGAVAVLLAMAAVTLTLGIRLLARRVRA